MRFYSQGCAAILDFLRTEIDLKGVCEVVSDFPYQGQIVVFVFTNQPEDVCHVYSTGKCRQWSGLSIQQLPRFFFLQQKSKNTSLSCCSKKPLDTSTLPRSLS